jgi:hypothetical protein
MPRDTAKTAAFPAASQSGERELKALNLFRPAPSRATLFPKSQSLGSPLKLELVSCKKTQSILQVTTENPIHLNFLGDVSQRYHRALHIEFLHNRHGLAEWVRKVLGF